MRRFALAIALWLAPGLVLAQDWQAEWNRIVAAAKQEGKVVVCMSSSVGRRDFLLKQ